MHSIVDSLVEMKRKIKWNSHSVVACCVCLTGICVKPPCRKSFILGRYNKLEKKFGDDDLQINLLAYLFNWYLLYLKSIHSVDV